MRLEKGEVICSNCKGSGNHEMNDKFTCQRCNGNGKVDWIENIVGVVVKPSSPFIYAPFIPIHFHVHRSDTHGVLMTDLTS